MADVNRLKGNFDRAGPVPLTSTPAIPPIINTSPMSGCDTAVDVPNDKSHNISKHYPTAIASDDQPSEAPPRSIASPSGHPQKDESTDTRLPSPTRTLPTAATPTEAVASVPRPAVLLSSRIRGAQKVAGTAAAAAAAAKVRATATGTSSGLKIKTRQGGTLLPPPTLQDSDPSSPSYGAATSLLSIRSLTHAASEPIPTIPGSPISAFRRFTPPPERPVARRAVPYNLPSSGELYYNRVCRMLACALIGVY